MDKSVFAALGALVLMLFPVLLAVFLSADMARKKAPLAQSDRAEQVQNA